MVIARRFEFSPRFVLKTAVVAVQFVTLTLAAASFPDPVVDTPRVAGKSETAVLAGGCFWGVEGVFESLRGV